MKEIKLVEIDKLIKSKKIDQAQVESPQCLIKAS